MNAIPILKSKLIMPQLPPAISGVERLRSLANSIYEHDLVSINAPAGYGKTTLLLWALNDYRTRGSRVCWYRLNEDDRELAVFYAHLWLMLFPEGEEFWDAPRAYLSQLGDLSTEYQYLNALICQEYWNLYNQKPALKTFLAFDDYHHITDNADIILIMQFLMDNLPPNCSVILCGRYDSGLISPRYRLDRKYTEITPGMLNFSQDELADYLQKAYPRIQDENILQRILQLTEGWPAGIVLLCQVINRNDFEGINIDLDRSDNHQLLFKYVFNEVLRTIDPELLRFLINVSIFDDFTAEQAEKALQKDNVLQLLGECEDKGLFLQKVLGDETEYRFHALFREALQQICPLYMTTQEMNDLHYRAAEYCFSHRQYKQAIGHLLASNHTDAVMGFITQENAQAIALEAMEEARIWINLQPDEVVSSNIYLLFFKGYSNWNHDGKCDKAAAYFEQALNILQPAKNSLMSTQIMNVLMHLYIEQNDIFNVLKYTEQALTLIGQNHDLPSYIEPIFTIIQACWNEDFAGTDQIIKRIQDLDIIDNGWEWLALAYPYNIYFTSGELSLARQYVESLVESNNQRLSEYPYSVSLIFYSFVCFLQDDIETHWNTIRQMGEITQKHPWLYIQCFYERATALAYYRKHDLDNALDWMDSSIQHFEELGNLPLQHSSQLVLLLWRCRQENPATLLPSAKKTLKLLTAQPTGWGLQEIGLSTCGAIAHEAGEYKLAEKYLLLAVKRSVNKGFRQIQAGALLHLAQLYFTMGDIARGEDYLEQAMDITVANGYVMFWDLYYPTMVELAVRSIVAGIKKEYISELIERHFGVNAAVFVNEYALLAERENLKDFIDLFLKQYGIRDENQGPAVSIRLLGRFKITVNGVNIPESEWKTKKIVGILKYLMVQRGQRVSRETLMEVFWPEADRNMAQNSLRAALSELKKVLNKYGARLDGPVPLFYETRDQLEVRCSPRLIVDVDRFRAYYDEYNNSGSFAFHRQKAILEGMLSLYQGDLLEQDFYENWLCTEREELRSIHLRLVIDLANIYLNEQAYDKAEKLLLNALNRDPYNEAACFCLLKLYINQHQKSRAVKLYRGFADRLEKELGIKPDNNLQEILGF